MKRIIYVILACAMALVLSQPITTQAQTGGLVWYVEYFPDKNLEGAPALTRAMPTTTTVPAINNYWSIGSPSIYLPPNDYSGRWTATANFRSGTYRFTLAANDGLRLYLDNALVIDQWHDQPFTAYTADMPLSEGSHTVRVEHYDSVHLAQIQFSFYRVLDGSNTTSQFAASGVQAKVVDFLRLRVGPSLADGYTDILDWGSIVNVLGRTADGQWLRVSAGNREGWIAATYTRLITGRYAEVPVWPTN